MNVGVPMPDPRDQIIATLGAQIERYLATGKRVQDIPSGLSANSPHLGTSTHAEKLRARRDANAPVVKAHAEAGKTQAETAKAMGIHIKTAGLIGKENGIKFAPAP